MRRNALMAAVFACGMMSLAFAQSGSFASIAGGPVSQLVTNKAVQEELKMTDDQIAKVKDWSTDIRLKAAEIRKEKGVEFGGKGAKGFAPPTPDQLEKIASANDEIRKISYKELEVILDKKQLERLKQIDRQNMGASALLNDEVTFALNVTDTQKTSIKGLVADLVKARGDIMKEALSGGPDVEKLQQAQKDFRKIEKEHFFKALDLLTNGQKKKWEAIAGDPFDLQKLNIQPPKKKD